MATKENRGITTRSTEVLTNAAIDVDRICSHSVIADVIPLEIINAVFDLFLDQRLGGFSLKFNIRYLLFATALFGFTFAILCSHGFRALLALSVLTWPSIMAFAVFASTMDKNNKINAILVSSVLVLAFSLIIISTGSDSTFSFLIAIFSFFVIAAAWLPQFLFFAMVFDPVEARRRNLD